MSYLKQEEVRISSLGDFLTIRQLPARAQIEMIEAQDKPFEGLFIACKHGVVAWHERSLDDIKDSITLEQASEISAAVFALSGVESKNSESDPSEGSSSV